MKCFIVHICIIPMSKFYRTRFLWVCVILLQKQCMYILKCNMQISIFRSRLAKSKTWYYKSLTFYLHYLQSRRHRFHHFKLRAWIILAWLLLTRGSEMDSPSFLITLVDMEFEMYFVSFTDSKAKLIGSSSVLLSSFLHKCNTAPSMVATSYLQSKDFGLSSSRRRPPRINPT